MDETRTCPNCKSPVPADAPGGACPRCLMAIAFATDAGAMVPDVAPGEVVSRFPGYEVTGTIGRGGMGVVFRARQRALDREVALKVLPGGPSRPAGFTQRFEREAKALARLQHPGIVQVFDFGTSADGWCFLAMELVEGVNLRRALADGRLAPKQALAIVPQICDALQYAHDHGVVHRDIKPENLLLTKDGRVKVADFGLAKLASDAHGASLTHTGHAMGTPLYMAPEQVEHPGDVDHRADIYSLGVVFYEMLTGELPIGRFAVPSKKSDVDSRIDDIVLRTLEKERDARFQRASEVKTKIDEASGPPPIPVPISRPAPPPLVPSAPRTPSRLSKLAVAAALMPLVVALAAVTVWTVNPGVHVDKKLAWAGLWCGSLAFIGVIASIAAWGRVGHSAGTMHGRWFAAIGLLGSPTALLTLALLYTWETGELSPNRSGIMIDQYGVQSSTMSVPPRNADQIAVERLFERYLASLPAPSDEVMTDLYVPEDLAAIRALNIDVRAARANAGLIGLPYATAEFIEKDPALMTIELMTFDDVAGTVSLRAGNIRLTAGVERVRVRTDTPEVWRFTSKPVIKVRYGGTTATPAPVGGYNPDGRSIGPASPRKPR